MADKFTTNRKVRDTIETIKLKGACAEAVAWWEERRDYTLLELAEEFARDDKTPQSWAVGYLTIFGQASDIKIRKLMIAKITDSMTAFGLYLDLSWLTIEEDKLLEAKFKGKVPTAEAELAHGIVKRKKS